MGSQRVTTQNLEIVKVDPERNLLLVRGAVPGFRNAYLIIKNAVKTKIKVRQEIVGKIKLVESKAHKETKKEKK